MRLASSDAIAIAPGLRALTPAELEPGYGAEHDADEHAAAAMRLWLSLADSRLTLTLSGADHSDREGVRSHREQRPPMGDVVVLAQPLPRGCCRGEAGCRVSLTIDVRNVTVSVLRRPEVRSC